MAPSISIVVRTYNEQKHLPRLLSTLEDQALPSGVTHEVVVVDSGSTDRTLAIAERCPIARITHIRKEDFSFGRSLNLGCRFALGQHLVFVSGHCIPSTSRWLDELTRPLRDGVVQYTYGRQLGAETTKFSEGQLFAKYFPEHSLIPQDGFFCNNANAAITRAAWETYGFDESLTGLEDMELAQRLVDDGGRVGYVAEAPVFHIHDESWSQVRHRYEREAVAMQRIAPNVHVSVFDTSRFWVSALLHDASAAVEQRCLLQEARNIVAFRTMQYLGTYKGNRQLRKVSHAMKMRYYYPTTRHHPHAPRDEGKQERRRSSAL